MLNSDGKEQESSESTEEASYSRAIQQEKAIYTESMANLKLWKPEIDHLKKVRSAVASCHLCVPL